MNRTALIIGNSDGIGLAVSRRLLKQGWAVAGISRSASPIHDARYRHTICDVQEPAYPGLLRDVLRDVSRLDVCVYAVGIGELLDMSNMQDDERVFAVNLMGLVKTIAVVLPFMSTHGGGHVIGLSSVADVLLSGDAPSYHASKAAFSNYLEGLALATKSRGVHVTNIRFGFVDTKMARGDKKPFMISVERAVAHVLHCIAKRPVRHTAPKVVIPLVCFRKWMMRMFA